MPSTRRASNRARLVLRIDTGGLHRSSPTLTSMFEGVELHLGIMLAGMQAIKIRPAVDTEQQGLAVDHESAVPVSQGGL